jgi:hypothetical protein
MQKIKKLIIFIFLLASCGDGGANELQELAVTSTTNNTTSSTNQEVASQDKEELKSECPLDEEKRFKIEIINESLDKTNLGLFFYINSLFNPLEENIKTQCVGINDINTFKFDFDMNNPPNIGRFGAGTENWYDICYQPKKDLFLSEEKITFLFSDDEIKITSELIYDRVIDRETRLVTFSKDDDSKPNKYCDNVDLNTSLPSTTTTTTLPENVVIEFENCIESIKDDAPFKLEFVIYAGNNDIDDITVFQKFLNNEYTESFKDSGLDLPVRGSYSGYYNSYDLKTVQANNWIKEFKVTVKTKSGSITTKTCKQTVIVTNPVTTTTTAPTTTTVPETTTTTTVPVDYPQLAIVEVSDSIPDYNRDDWNHWIDENSDCQNTRHEVLIEESQETVTYTSDTYCFVSTGKWFGYYTGQYYYNASELDMDHFIPLRNAHQSGGYNWSSSKKEEFANYRLDPDNLIAVNLSANRSKGAKGPEEWKPANVDYWCQYAYDWIRIKEFWSLTATQAEWDALISMIETCPEDFKYADAQQEPLAELPTPTTTTTSTTTTTVGGSQPANPGNSKNCGDFSNYAEAKAWFDTYYPFYGDIGDLDRDEDLIPCESLSGAP